MEYYLNLIFKYKNAILRMIKYVTKNKIQFNYNNEQYSGPLKITELLKKQKKTWWAGLVCCY